PDGTGNRVFVPPHSPTAPPRSPTHAALPHRLGGRSTHGHARPRLVRRRRPPDARPRPPARRHPRRSTGARPDADPGADARTPDGPGPPADDQVPRLRSVRDAVLRPTAAARPRHLADVLQPHHAPG